ncbi:MAG: hypothetical protein INR71_09020 [Terriglobus roseus]|nr:hypothetical protein [Terriglobus roseus]
MLVLVVVVLLPSPAAAFGAGNIASVSKIEGQNFRHGVRALPFNPLLGLPLRQSRTLRIISRWSRSSKATSGPRS